MFTPKKQPNNSTAEKKEDIPVPVALALMGGVVVLLVCLNPPDLSKLYQENFTTIWQSVAFIGFAVLAAILWAINYFTREAKSKFTLLSPYLEKDAGVFVGSTTDGDALYLPDDARTEHVQIIGATGRGKTESVILPWLMRDLVRGRSAVLIDGKGELQLAERIKNLSASMASRPQVYVFHLSDPKQSVVINPLAGGSPQQITDRLFSAFTFGDPYWRSVQYDLCRDMVTLIHEVDENCKGNRDVTFRRLHELLTEKRALIDAVEWSTDLPLRSSMGRLLCLAPKDRDQHTRGLVSQLAPFAVGEVASLVNGDESEGHAKNVNVSDLVLGKVPEIDPNRPVVLVVLIPTLKYQALGHQLGKLILQELAWAIGARSDAKSGAKPFLPVYLDEFSAFIYQEFAQTLNKARSANVGLHLAHQSMGDLELASPEFATMVNTNTNVKCLLGLNDPVTAEFFARHMGTATEEKRTERAQSGPWGWLKRTGELSLRSVEAYKVHPNQLKNFSKGEGVIHFPTPQGNITECVSFARLGVAEL